MKVRKMWIVVGGFAILLLAAGVAGAVPSWSPPSPTAVAATVSSGISYQGRLTNASGTALNGTYTMRFVVYDDAVAGTALWDSGDMSITVENGLFAVKLGVDQADMNGQALWVSIIVDGQTRRWPGTPRLPARRFMRMRPAAWAFLATAKVITGFGGKATTAGAVTLPASTATACG
ncbi:MAG: hypothetical protein ACE5E7_13910 [Anaerolineae bacterium]